MSEFEKNNGEMPEAMTEFERSLQRALRHVEVRADTTAKFLAIAEAAGQQRKQTGRMWFKPRTGGLLLVLPHPRAWGSSWASSWVGGALAALLVLGVMTGERLHRHQERAAANREFAMSMQIEERAMEHTRLQLQKAGVPLD